MTPDVALASLARLVRPRLVALVRGSKDDQAEQSALAKASWAVASDLVFEPEASAQERIEFVAASLLECLGRSDKVLLGASAGGSTRDAIAERLSCALEPLDEVDVGLTEMGIAATARQVAEMFVDQLTDNLLLWGAKSPYIRDLALQLQIDRLSASAVNLRIAEEGVQARQIRAWITVETDPPQVEVWNDSDGPIFEVVPTPALVAKSVVGEVIGTVGHSSLWSTRAAQISPGFGYVWPLPHMTEWGREPLVFSQLHLDFTDNAGRRWRNAHDRLSRIDN